MMLSMGTFPISPVKKSSSVMLELIRRSAGRRISVRANLQIQLQEGVNKENEKEGKRCKQNAWQSTDL